MALTMVHLLAADLWAQAHGAYLQSPEFYLGAVSPDAIHIRDHDDKSHKDEIHLYNWQSLHREPAEAYWREHSAPFDIGYGVHVLTDCQWVQRYRTRLRDQLMPDGKLDIPTYYNDTFVTDFALFRSIPRLNEILDMIARAKSPGDHPLLTRAEFDAWRDMIVTAYRGECPKSDPVRCITTEYVLEFVKDCVPLIEEIYRGVFG